MKEQRGMPVFVKVEEYRQILDIVDLIKGKVRQLQDTISTMSSLREEEDAELEMWSNTIKEIEKKIDDMDKMMFEPEHAW